MFGAEELDTAPARLAELAAGKIPLGVGAGTVVRRAIIDRNARVGRGVRLVNEAGVRDSSRAPGLRLPAGVVIREGIICVTRGAVVPDGTVV
jgi:glucose-1-phosphate adenylyltransferase